MAAPFALRYYIGPDIQRIAPQTPNLTADQVVGNQYGGFFRLQNCASGRLLTSVKSITGDGYSLQGYNLRVPDPNDPISQVNPSCYNPITPTYMLTHVQRIKYGK